MKKTSYNKCLVEQYGEFRNFIENYGDKNYNSNIIGYKAWLLNGFTNSNVDSKIASRIADAIGSILDADIRGNGTHIFIRDIPLYEALQEITVKDIEGLISYIKENAKEYKFMHYVLNPEHKVEHSEEYTQKCLFYFIHYPDEKEGLSVRLRLDDNELCCDYVCGNDCATFSSESKYLKHPESETDLMDQKMWQLLLNVFFYMKAFPECVKSGVPSGFRFENPSATKKVELKISDKIVKYRTDNRNGTKHVVPHFRKGHFRYLGSDYYVNKKGQFIFIEETMVGSKDVVTVETKEEI